MPAGEIWKPPRSGTAEEVLVGSDALSLSAEAAGSDWRKLEEPLPVWVWLQFRTFERRVAGEAVAMTQDAVEVRWDWRGHPQRPVVWRAAVKHRAAPPQR
ncbi:hypothetical protein DEJ30_08060 [Curtobacterium sp. MCPF17_003]|nr:hypothetical protein DEJ30_08060 [Curtobacterium sp. MCPF17_003]